MTATSPDDAGICHIRSTTDDIGRAACLLQWGPVTALLTPEVVLATGRDLAAAAAAAECDAALVKALRGKGANDQVIGTLLMTVRRARPVPPGQAALRISAVAGARTGLPLVHIARGPMKGELSPEEARDMALHWVTVAAAAQIDVRMRYALGEWGHLTPADIEQLFVLVQGAQR